MTVPQGDVPTFPRPKISYHPGGGEGAEEKLKRADQAALRGDYLAAQVLFRQALTLDARWRLLQFARRDGLYDLLIAIEDGFRPPMVAACDRNVQIGQVIA